MASVDALFADILQADQLLRSALDQRRERMLSQLCDSGALTAIITCLCLSSSRAACS